MILDEAKKNSLRVVVYDDSSCPTGCLGGQFYLKAPQHAAKSLDMVEKNVTGPAKAELAIPEGVYIGAVMMNRDTFQLIDVSNRKGQNNGLVCRVPKGNWKVMDFYLKTVHVQTNRGGGAGSVDYLDEAAMDTFISLSYDKYYSHFKEYFGNVIKMFYYDEPTMHNADGRLWTPSFNQNFEKKYGYSPMKYYPALWYDIGPGDRRGPQRALRLSRPALRGQLSQEAQQMVR